ncbi:MAG: TonB-dependent receptor [Ignavibacteria bacterium]|jgi:outer membrane receptor protein involved in Fe transport
MVNHFGKTKYAKLVKLIIMYMLFNGTLFAGNTGKIVGLVVDADNGEPLIGVNILIEGTKTGAATDLEGKFTIIGISPGNYSVIVSYVGYQKVTLTNVKVIIDRTTDLKIEMHEKSLEFGEEIVVEAKKPPIALDVSSSKRDIEISDVESIPVKDFNSLLNLQPGTIYQPITNDTQEQITNELSIRGGTGVGVFVDGLNVTEAMSSGSLTNFNLSSLKVAEILTGGFNAEYGNIRSGVINVVTKDGTDKYQLSLDVKVSPASRKHFGESIYDQNSAPEWVLYGNDDALYGEDGIHDADNPDSYWEYFAMYDTVYGFTPEQAQEVWKYQHRERQYGHKPDYIIDASFGGPLPYLKNYKLGRMITFFTSLRFEYNMFAVPISRDHFEDLNWFWKFTIRPGSGMKINVQGNYQQNYSSTTYNTPQESVSTPEQAIFSMQYPLTKYYEGMRSIADRYRNQFAVNLSHALSEKTYYNFKLSYLLRRSFVNHADYRSSEGVFTVGGYTFDSTPSGYADEASVVDFGGREADFGLTTKGYSFIFGGHGKERDFSKEILISTRFDLVSQVNKNNQVKTGFEFTYDDLNMHHGLVQQSPPLIKMDKFRRIPIKAAYYLQDKIEFKGMIANVGVRLDYTDRRTDYYTDLYSDYLNVDSIDFAATDRVNPFFYVSPRIGIAHPISEKSKLFFNYGHFYDEPSVTYLYNKRERYGGNYDRINNANLNPQRTIAYELGFDQQLGEQYLLHISGYYRNITNQIMWVAYYSDAGNQISTYSNGNYADSRGFEVIFEKKLGTYFIGSLSLDYMVTSSGDHGNEIYYEDELKTPVLSSSTQSTPGASYTFIANVTFRTPKEWGKDILGIDLFGDWALNLTHEYRSGKTFTYNPQNLPGVSNNLRWRPHHNTNMRLSKGFEFIGINCLAYMEVYNLFNRKELNPNLRSLLLPQLSSYTDYLDSLILPEEGGDDQPGDYEADHIVLPDPGDFPTQLLFKTPRDIYFGIKVNF